MRFLRSHGQGGANSWGLLVSADNGRTWSQRIVEKDLSVKEWVTEPSLVDLGGGRLLIVGRCEQNLGNVKATRLGDADCCAWYTGTQSNATVVVTVVEAPGGLRHLNR